MRVRTYLSILVLVCTLGAWLVETLIVSRFSELEQRQNQVQSTLLLAKDFDYLQHNVQQLLVTSDLIIGSGETYLSPGAVSQAKLLSRQISENLALAGDFIPEATAAGLLLNFKTLAGTLEAVAIDPQMVTGQLLDDYDTLALDLVGQLEGVSNQVGLKLNESKRSLSLARQQASRGSTLATTAFVLLIGALWLWANRRISVPLNRLADMASRAQDDYAFKGIDDGPREVRLLSERLVSLTDLLLSQAKHDPLTNLYNRREFERQMTLTLCHRRTEDQNTPNCLCYIDLDHFKLVNDTCGHAAGDEVLVQVARALLDGVRKSDIVARLGGDEFCLLLRNCKLPKAREIAETIRQDIEKIHYRWGLKTLEISASIGLCEIPEGVTDAQETMQSVDIACAAAKNSGRNQVQVVGSDGLMVVRKRNDMVLVNRVTSALRAGRVDICLQSIVPLQKPPSSKRYFEALARLSDEDNQVIMPGEFLPIIERYGMSSRLDCAVLERVIHGFAANPAALALLTTVGVNISALTMGEDRFETKLKQLLDDTDYPAEKLCLEITETAAVKDQAKAARFASQIKKLGVRFALDDFGSGHASFNYLKSFPVDSIKIDGQFVRGMLDDDMDLATIKSVVEIAGISGRTTVAEFVETQDLAQRLTDLGVDYAQGYYFSRPTPMAEVLADLTGETQVLASA